MTTLVVIAALLVFLATRSRRNPLFLAGAAAYLTLGRSIYIDIFPGLAELKVSSLTVTSGDLLFAAVSFGWWYARARRPIVCARLAPVWSVIGILVVYFFAMEFALTWASKAGLRPTLMLAARDWFYIPLGYFMTLDVLRRFTPRETAQYVGVLSLFTACASLLYIASALNLPIYPYQKYLITSFHGSTIVGFLDFPVLGRAGLVPLPLTAQQKGLDVLGAGSRRLCGPHDLLSHVRRTPCRYRSALCGPVARPPRQAQAGIVVGAVFASLAVSVLVIGPVVAPAQLGYLQSRFGGMVQSHSVVGDPNVQGRVRVFNEARAAGARVDAYLGAGLFDSSDNIDDAAYISPDSDWIGIVYRTGLAGIIVLATPLAVALLRGIGGSQRARVLNHGHDVDAHWHPSNGLVCRIAASTQPRTCGGRQSRSCQSR